MTQLKYLEGVWDITCRMRYIQELHGNGNRALWIGIAVLTALASHAWAFEWPGASPWPNSSLQPVRPLPHPTIHSRLNQLGDALDGGFRFVVFGDQRALADGEWQALVEGITTREKEASDSLPLLGVIDTGDIVQNGSHSDQFAMLSSILNPLREYPYVLSVGNHELNKNEGEGRPNTVAAMSASMPWASEDSLWYEYSLPHVRLVILDTNDLVYGPSGKGGDPFDHPRVQRQFLWLEAILAESDARPIMVVMHHPFISSSRKHRSGAADLWSLTWRGRTLPEIMADGGVDLILAGHTHTYERFRLKSSGGSTIHLVNVSGRPRDSFFWWGSGARRANDWRDSTIEHLQAAGWKNLEGWQIEQESPMLDEQDNQWVELHVFPDGKIDLETFFLANKGWEGFRPGERATISEGTGAVR